MPEEQALVENAETSTGDTPEVEESRKSLVKEWEGKIVAAKKHWAPVFKQMRKNQDFAAHGAPKDWCKSGKYVVPILNRHINQAVAQLYARNPKAAAKRRRKLMYQLWDGRSDSLQAAMEMATLGDAGSMQLVQEVLAVRQHEQMVDRLGKTMELLWEHFLGEQEHGYKKQIKAAVRRAKVNKVAYIKLAFQRALEQRPEVMARIEDTTSKIRAMEAILHEAAEDRVDDQSPRLEELRLLLADLQTEQFIIANEGPILDFPKSDEIIPDPKCRHLKTFAGARWVAQEYEMEPTEVLETYQVDISSSFTKYHTDGRPFDKGAEAEGNVVSRVYEVYDKRNKQKFTICEGWPDFLEEPAEPQPFLERFWPWFPIVFNEVEHDKELYPPSDVESAQHIQNEYNRSRESLRQHRIANRPYYVEGGRMEEEEKWKLAHHDDHDIITVPSLGAGESVDNILQRGPTNPIDPNLYEVEMHFNDLLRVVGRQEAQLGATSDSTATEASIAENSQSVATADNVDDLDEVLTDVAKAMGHMMLMELDKETVIEIVGEGAVWPDLPETRQEVIKDLMLEIEAGSSGRPNQAAELAKIERAAPTLIQIPELNPKPLVRRYGELLDIDTEELVAEGIPSITAINAIMAKAGIGGPGTGDPESDPNQQGGEGAQNAQGPQQNEDEPGGQPAFPAPSVVA